MAPELLSESEIGYFFGFSSYPGPWPLEGFVNELGGAPIDHVAPLEALVARGLVVRYGEGEQATYEPTDAGEKAFHDARTLIRAKSTIDGAVTLSEAAARLRKEAELYEQMERDGWQLVDVVEDDYGHLLRTRESFERARAEAEIATQVGVEIDHSRDRLSDLADER